MIASDPLRPSHKSGSRDAIRSQGTGSQGTTSQGTTSQGIGSLDDVSFGSIFRKDCIETVPDWMDKEEMLRHLVDLLVTANRLDRNQADPVTKQLLERESYGSSAIGKGLAFPHLRTADVQRFVGAIGIAPQGVHFGSLDQEPTKLVFLTLSPAASRQQHIQLLSRLVNLMKDKFVSIKIQQLFEPEVLYRYLCDLDA